MKIPGKPAVSSKPVASTEIRQGTTLEKHSSLPIKQLPPLGVNKTNITSLLSSLKMPPDNLSRVIITFARFFSLPLEPKLLNSLRREALGPKIINREAAAMAAAVAADKGIKLGEKAFIEYSNALEGFVKNFSREQLDEFAVYRRLYDPAEQESNQQQGGGHNTGAGNPDGQEPKHQETGSQEQKKKQDSGMNKAVSPEIIQQQIIEILKKWPLLDLINRIPGKNGRWIILPFSFIKENLEISVSLNLYISSSLHSGSMFMDLKVNSIDQKKPIRHWQIIIKKPETKAGITVELGVFSASAAYAPVKQQYLKKELAKILEISPDTIQIRENPSIFTDLLMDLEEEILQSIDLKV